MVRKTTKKNKENQSLVIQQVEQYSGLIPHPNIVERYEELCSGATDRILKIAESEVKSRQELEHKEQENIHKIRLEEMKLKQRVNIFSWIFIVVFVIVILVLGAVLIYLNKDIGGYGTIISGIAIIIKIVWNKKI